MARELIRQPNGLYAMFTTNRDAFLFINGTREEVIEYLGGERIQVAENEPTRTWEAARSANNTMCHARGGQPVIMRGDRPVWQGRVVEGVTPLHRDVDTEPVRANPDVAADFLVDMPDAMAARVAEDDFLRIQAAECGVRSIAYADLDTGALRDLFAMDMIARGFVTGHGDTLAELHAALWKQIDEDHWAPRIPSSRKEMSAIQKACWDNVAMEGDPEEDAAFFEKVEKILEREKDKHEETEIS